MSNIVTQPEDRDPNELAQERSTPSLNMPNQVNTNPPNVFYRTLGPGFHGTRAVTSAEQAAEPMQATPLDEPQSLEPPPQQQEGNSSEPPDFILPSLPSPLEGTGVPSLFEQFQPMQYEAPEAVPLLEDDETRLNEIRAQALQEEAYDDVIFSNNLRQRVQDAYNVTTRTRYSPPIQPTQQRPAWLNSAEDLIAERNERVQQAATPPGLNPQRGLLGVGRNVLSGRPFADATKELINDQFRRLAEVEGDEYQGIARRVWNLVPRAVRNAIPFDGLIVDSIDQGVRNIQIIRDTFAADRELSRTDPNYRSLGERALEELQRTFIPTPEQQRERYRRLTPGADPVRFRGYSDPDRPPAPLLEALTENSSAFRDLLDDLAPTLDEAGNANFNLARGEFGEFGSAGAFSAALYAMNIGEGILTGTLYDIADDIRNVASRINPEWAPPERNLQRVDALSPFYGRDTSFTQEYSEDRYLAAAGNPALSWMPRQLQWATGFVGDLVTGSVADGIFDGIVSGLRQGTQQAARRTITERGQGISAAASAAAESILRNSNSGVRSAATEAVIPTVRSTDTTAVTRASMTATPGNQLVTVEDVMDRVEGVIRQLDGRLSGTLRIAEQVGDAANVRRLVEQSTLNYELTLRNSVREAESLMRTMTRQDFQGFVSSTLNRLGRRGVGVATDGVITRTYTQTDEVLDNLIAPIRAELSSPLYRDYPEILDTYRESPLALPPEAYDLVKRTNAQLADLAKTWEQLPNTATASNFRTMQLQSVAPEFGNVWGTRIDENISAPLRRIITRPENGLRLQPEQSQVVGSLPPVTVDVSTQPVNQLPPPDDILKRMNSIQAKYAEAVNVFANKTGSAQRRALARMETLRQEGAALIADYPEVALEAIANQQPLPRRYTTPSDRTVATLDVAVKQENRTLQNLQQQLGVVSNRRQQQQRLLQDLPPLERRFVNSDINTELLNGSEPGIRAVNTPTNISPETVYPAARREVWQTLEAQLRAGQQTTARELIEQGELATLPTDEALATLSNMRDNGSIMVYDPTGQPTFRALQIDDTVELNLGPDGDQLTTDALVGKEYEQWQAVELDFLDDESIVVRLENLADPIRPGEPGINQRVAMPDKRARTVDLFTDELGQAAAEATVPQDFHPLTVFYDDANSAQRAYMERTGQWYLEPLFIDPEEASSLFADRAKALADAKAAGVVGANDEEVLRRYTAVVGGANDAEFINLLPLARETPTNITNNVEVPIPLQQRLEIVEAHSMRRYIEVTPDGVNVDYTRKRLGNPSAHGEAWLNADGTVTKIGRIGSRETELQRAAALQGFAPEVLTDVIGDQPNYQQYTMQFLEGYEPLENFKGKLDLPTLENIRARLMRIVDNLHDSGITHSDIHDGNVMYNPTTGDIKLIDFGLSEELPKQDGLPLPADDKPFTFDYNLINDLLAEDYGLPGQTFYHGSKHTVMSPGIDSWSLSNEFGPALYLTPDLGKAEMYAKAVPAQDVVTNSTNRIPRTDQIGNVRAITIGLGFNDVQGVATYSIQIAESFDEALKAVGEGRLARNFSQWRKKAQNTGPINWWHHIRERYLRDGRTAELARLQLDIRDRLVGKGVQAFGNPITGDVVVLDPSLIRHNSVPHAVESTGTVAEGLVYRHAVDADLHDAIGNKTTEAILEHDRLNLDTYVEEQLKRAVSQQERDAIDAVRELQQARSEQQRQWVRQRANSKAQRVRQLEREASREINKFIRSAEEFCL